MQKERRPYDKEERSVRDKKKDLDMHRYRDKERFREARKD